MFSDTYHIHLSSFSFGEARVTSQVPEAQEGRKIRKEDVSLYISSPVSLISSFGEASRVTPVYTLPNILSFSNLDLPNNFLHGHVAAPGAVDDVKYDDGM